LMVATCAVMRAGRSPAHAVGLMAGRLCDFAQRHASRRATD
jgi:hypothetical protein